MDIKIVWSYIEIWRTALCLLIDYAHTSGYKHYVDDDYEFTLHPNLHIQVFTSKTCLGLHQKYLKFGSVCYIMCVNLYIQ